MLKSSLINIKAIGLLSYSSRNLVGSGLSWCTLLKSIKINCLQIDTHFSFFSPAI
ncbi:hypothetical protein NEOC65_002152 [Neochlamydia sp. AcF65]|nr:hypothetical protein [Neochlamydia sp. AcF65]MBS4170732.1 hypothetical protein [Neochlamydia sp. AcF95]NGY94394.1 hypothetical protein [Neochlamydia sp. AcF84]